MTPSPFNSIPRATSHSCSSLVVILSAVRLAPPSASVRVVTERPISAPARLGKGTKQQAVRSLDTLNITENPAI